MPLYEYVCKHCKHPFEEIASSDQVAPACPKCAAPEADRVLFSRVSVGKAGADVAPSPCGNCCGDPRGPGGCGMG